MTQHILPVRSYVTIFGALLVLTATTVGIALVDLGPFNIVAALAIAAGKTTLVLLFFMHMKYSKPLIPLVALAGLVWLAILIGLTLGDYFSRNWLPVPRGL